jgi:hypothetical protein
MSVTRNIFAAALLSGLFFCCALLIGCSGGTSEPVTPDVNAEEPARRQLGSPGRVLWGYYEGFADTETGTFELTALRGVSTHFNLVSILNQTGGITTKVIWSEGNPTMGNFTLKITLHNPYAGSPIINGFDVRGIFITGAAHPIGSNLWVAGEGEPRLINPDGWTRWWNPLEFITPGLFGYVDGILGPPNTSGSSAQVNAYKVFADALPEDEDDILMLSYLDLDDPQGRSVFSAEKNSRIYKIDFPKGSNLFYYAVDASWAYPSGNPPEVPDDYPPNANCHEAWYIRYDVIQNTLEYNTDTEEGSGELMLYITLCDWQGMMNGAIAPQIEGVNIHSTDLYGFKVATGELIYDDGIQAMYLADLTSLCNLKRPGTHWVGVEAISTYGKYKQSWQDAPNKPLAAYQLIPIQVKQTMIEPPPLVKKFGIHAYVLCRSDGSSPAISDDDIYEDIQWANDFWGKYGFGFELAKKDYLHSDAYWNIPYGAGKDLYNWHHDSTGIINLYYVYNIIGFSGAYCMMTCSYQYTKAKDTYIIFDSKDCNGWEEILAHELGHNIGMLHDEYLLDTYGSCTNLDWWMCGAPDSDIYCSEADAVKNNLMYWLRDWPGSPWDYFISSTDLEMNTPAINSQGENAVYFHTHYPYNFKDMQ